MLRRILEHFPMYFPLSKTYSTPTDASNESRSVIQYRPPEGMDGRIYVVDHDPVNEALSEKIDCGTRTAGVWLDVGPTTDLVGSH
ncbi:hypothetical protein GCM10007898_43630 [Dyella flagellata]|uniref:Uncharacterized protein n=1 Tax=Dyella flagellata TaxID=1867833 RepID=A0ABQ5XGU4_9GAMM|nr:hypothetical protein GCM10007898_43630 [Dyella flagellata]